jgi:predicted phage tail protein
MKKVLSAVVTASAVLASQAQAAGTDFSSLTSAVDASTIVTAIVAMGAVMILPGVAKWGVRKIAGFFG